MKKLFSIISIVLIIALFYGCSFESSSDADDAHDHNHDHTHETESSVAETQAVGEVQATTENEVEPDTKSQLRADADGPLSSKHSAEIDTPCENELDTASSDAEKSSIYDNYRGEWEKVGKRYYKENLYYNGEVPVHPDFSTDKELHEFVELRKKEFDGYFDSECKSYLVELESQYGKGSKANLLCAEYKYELQRSFALEMIEIYELLGEFNGQVF